MNLANIKADSLINFTLQQYYAGLLLNQSSDLAGTQQRIVDFITYIYCFNGYSPLADWDQIFNAQNSVLIRNTTPTTVVTDPAKHAGVKINQGDVPSEVDGLPFFGTYVSVIKTTDPLPTSLDWYGIDGYKAGAFEFVTDPEVTFDNPVLAGVCISYDDAIVTSPNDIRLAHTAPSNPADVAAGNYVVTTAGGSIEIAAPLSAGPLGLACQPLPFQSASLFGRTFDRVADMVLPTYLFAATTGGSTGGTVKRFSPFAGVDSKLLVTSTGPTSPQYIPLNSTTTTAPVTATATTRNSHAGIDNIPVAFATGTAGSSFSPASANTNASGTAASTWTLVAGANSGTGTPAQAPLVFTPAAANFSVNVIQETTLSFDAPLTLPAGTQGGAYPTTTFTATGGIGTYSWAVTSGALPAGLTLTTAGILSGTTTTSGNFSFNVTVTSGGQTQSKSYSVSVTLAAHHRPHAQLRHGTVEADLLRVERADDTGNPGQGGRPERHAPPWHHGQHGRRHQQWSEGDRHSVVGSVGCQRNLQFRWSVVQQDRWVFADRVGHQSGGRVDHIGEVHCLPVLPLNWSGRPR